MEHILRTELREQAAAVSDLRAQQARSQEVLALAARQMAAVVGRSTLTKACAFSLAHAPSMS